MVDSWLVPKCLCHIVKHNVLWLWESKLQRKWCGFVNALSIHIIHYCLRWSYLSCKNTMDIRYCCVYWCWKFCAHCSHDNILSCNKWFGGLVQPPSTPVFNKRSKNLSLGPYHGSKLKLGECYNLNVCDGLLDIH